MPALSPPYERIKKLRSTGDCAAAIALLRRDAPASDDDAFEAVVCLFVCGDIDSALNVCRTYAWKREWAIQITSALSERLAGSDVPRALALARSAAAAPGAPYDVSAIYLLLLQENGLIDEADTYIRTRLQNPPPGETFLLTVMAEIAIAASNWRQAYRAATAVLAADPDDYRALLASSIANCETGNTHEALGNAHRAYIVDRSSAAATLQIMRCQNKLGDYYAALAAFEKLGGPAAVPADMHVELGIAFCGLDDRERGLAEFRTALDLDPRSATALRELLASHAIAGDTAAVESLVAGYFGPIHADIDCLYWLGIAALNRGDLDAASGFFQKSHALAQDVGEALRDLQWPVIEPRLRHDVEQLELLGRRGKLPAAGRNALEVLKKYYAPQGDAAATFAPRGVEAQALKRALSTVHHVPDLPYAAQALGENDYGEIECRYLAKGLVVIDNFLSPGALALLRRFCEEATVWKLDNARGYIGAVLAQGFSPTVLLKLSDELRRAMPQVFAGHPLLQAWAFKDDQRMQGINLHADFAKVNVNFWITPDEACADAQTGGLVVYDLPVPKSWTFAEYNTESEKLAVYLKVHNASFQRVPYRSNRCVLFDSSLIHVTDEMHFKPGYENRRVNVTLLYGKARSVE